MPQDDTVHVDGPDAEAEGPAADSGVGSDVDSDAGPVRVRRRRRRPTSEAPPQSRRRRVSFWLGCGLIAGGLAVLGWVAWQFWGTNWQSQQRHGDVRASLQDGWGDGQDVVRTEFGNASAILHIPRFGDDYSVPVLEGSTDEVLASGVGHMDDTAEAGAKGNYVLAGHRVTHGEPFADLPELEVGDLVYVETREFTYTYELDTGGEDLIVPFTASWVLDPSPVNPQEGGTQPPDDVGEHLITLLTCSEIFHTDNRSVLFGHLIETTPASG